MAPPTTTPAGSSAAGMAEDPDKTEAARLQALRQLDPGQAFRQNVYFKA